MFPLEGTILHGSKQKSLARGLRIEEITFIYYTYVKNTISCLENDMILSLVMDIVTTKTFVRFFYQSIKMNTSFMEEVSFTLYCVTQWLLCWNSAV